MILQLLEGFIEGARSIPYSRPNLVMGASLIDCFQPFYLNLAASAAKASFVAGLAGVGASASQEGVTVAGLVD